MLSKKNRSIIVLLLLTPFLYLTSLLGPINQAKAANAVITGSVINVRSGPGTEYQVSGNLYEKTLVTVLDIRDVWTMIQYGNLQGWVNNEFISAVQAASSAGPTPKVILNGKPLSFEVSPRIESNRILIPMRTIFDTIGAAVEWDQTTQTATVTRGNIKIVLPINSTSPTVNGKVCKLDVPARVYQQRTLVPLRFIGEALGGTAGWDPATNTVHLTSPPASGTTPVAVKVVSNKVNLRSEPSTSSSIAGTSFLGETLPIVGQQNGFYQINRRGTKAWVASWVVDVVWGYKVQWNPDTI